ncbi:four helix bundle protein [Patescibacteria group bacterium]
MPNQAQSPKTKYDLEERTAKFAEEVIELVKKIPETAITRSIISQLVRSSGSIGANYMEADGAESKKDFRHKIAICKKEAKETRHWLRLLAKAYSKKQEECRKLWKEVQELTLIFSAILRK